MAGRTNESFLPASKITAPLSIFGYLHDLRAYGFSAGKAATSHHQNATDGYLPLAWHHTNVIWHAWLQGLVQGLQQQ